MSVSIGPQRECAQMFTAASFKKTIKWERFKWSSVGGWMNTAWYRMMFPNPNAWGKECLGDLALGYLCVCVCVCILPVCMQCVPCPGRPEVGVGFPWRELNLGPSEEQPVLLAVEPSLHPQAENIVIKMQNDTRFVWGRLIKPRAHPLCHHWEILTYKRFTNKNDSYNCILSVTKV